MITIEVECQLVVRAPSPLFRLMVATSKRKRFTVEDYHRMSRAGVLSEEDRVELIEGDVVEMAPIGSQHAGHVKRIASMFRTRLGEEVLISVRDPVQLGEYSEPEPDLALLEPRDDYYASSHPGPDDVRLLVEVADSSLEFDRETKIPMYARHGIPVVWLVNLRDRRVELHEDPEDEAYQIVHSLRGDAPLTFAPLSFECEAEDLFVPET